MRTRSLFALGVTLAACLAAETTLPAQQKPATPAKPAEAQASDIETLKREIQALVAGQVAIQKQLDDIKTILARTPAAAAPAPTAAPPPVSVVDSMIETAGAAFRGSATAKVAIVEFSDFECPFCGRYTRDTVPQLLKEYVDTGKVKYVFRNLPLESIHPSALRAAVAAECAGDQGKYWPLHDYLYANQTALDAPSILNGARTAGLDVTRFQQCIASDKPTTRIKKDQADAQQAGAGSTPTIFIAVTTPGDSKVRAVRLVRGAQAYPTFKGAIDSVLASAK
jgi:protein-disulfide isomerase